MFSCPVSKFPGNSEQNALNNNRNNVGSGWYRLCPKRVLVFTQRDGTLFLADNVAGWQFRWLIYDWTESTLAFLLTKGESIFSLSTFIGHTPLSASMKILCYLPGSLPTGLSFSALGDSLKFCHHLGVRVALISWQILQWEKQVDIRFSLMHTWSVFQTHKSHSPTFLALSGTVFFLEGLKNHLSPLD